MKIEIERENKNPLDIPISDYDEFEDRFFSLYKSKGIEKISVYSNDGLLAEYFSDEAYWCLYLSWYEDMFEDNLEEALAFIRSNL